MTNPDRGYGEWAQDKEPLQILNEIREEIPESAAFAPCHALIDVLHGKLRNPDRFCLVGDGVAGDTIAAQAVVDRGAGKPARPCYGNRQITLENIRERLIATHRVHVSEVLDLIDYLIYEKDIR